MPVRDSLLELSSVELRRRIGSKEISPVELMEASIARMEALNPSVNAICATAYTRARREAKAAEKAALAGESPTLNRPVVAYDQPAELERITYKLDRTPDSHSRIRGKKSNAGERRHNPVGDVAT